MERRTTPATPVWAVDEPPLRRKIMRALGQAGLAVRRMLRG
ncbi:MAG: hypothetical protein AABO58_11070 [Acidobacteriota bacterium]